MRFTKSFILLRIFFYFNFWCLYVSAQGQYICLGPPIPEGYVIIKLTSSNCGAFLVQQYIEPVKDGIEICFGSPLPNGYVITRLNANGCGGVGRYIEKPRNGMVICRDSPIPHGYVVTRVILNGCGSAGQYIELLIGRR
ncbi:unnamed protein product [Adineta steineri]|uniref:Uncharacterized protein n=1 Tax=Adineta steineri TaxID=433720 RepID=A0A814BUJ5_9BILA|nr:unnamed protein product [Adineta steineri]CAF3895098.1 unnamed protein product [Adineta steineri]